MSILSNILLFFHNPVIKATWRRNGPEGYLTLYYKSGRIEKYLGGCTCWAELPDMRVVGIMEEDDLYSFEKRCKYSKNKEWIRKVDGILTPNAIRPGDQ